MDIWKYMEKYGKMPVAWNGLKELKNFKWVELIWGCKNGRTKPYKHTTCTPRCAFIGKPMANT